MDHALSLSVDAPWILPAITQNKPSREHFHALGHVAILSARSWSRPCIAPPAVLDVHLEFTILTLEVLVHHLDKKKEDGRVHPFNLAFFVVSGDTMSRAEKK